MRLVWDGSGWEDYSYWQSAHRKVLERMNTLIDAYLQHPFAGIGKPVQLTYELSAAVSGTAGRCACRGRRRRGG